MSGQADPGAGSLTRIDLLCDRFERACKGGQRPKIEEYLKLGGATEEARLFRELLILELDYRQRASHELSANDYEGRFPAQTSTIREVFEQLSVMRDDEATPVNAHSASTIPWVGDTSISEATQTSVYPGQRFGDYELIHEIARGGMGVVYKARQIGLNRDVALKMILSGTLADTEEIRRFRSEAEAAATLHHPNIVAIHEVGQINGRHYFSMDLVDAESLAKSIDGRPLSAKTAGKHAEQIARTIHYAHQRGILHRDVKPSNVLIDRAGNVRLTDFGLAKRVNNDSQLTGTGQILGSPSYMSPEQASGRNSDIGPPADVYSIGATLYEALTGRPPFRGESQFDTLVQVIENDPVPPRQLNPKVPRDIETICLKCLEKEPRRRYGNAADLAADLQRFTEGRPIKARPVSSTERAVRWCVRRPVYASLIAAIFLIALTGLAGVFSQWRQTAHAQVETLRKAEPDAVTGVIDGLQPYLSYLGPHLKGLANDPRLPDRERIRISLALLPRDSTQEAYLHHQLFRSDAHETRFNAREFRLIRDALLRHESGAFKAIEALFADADSLASRRFKAACFLAGVPDYPREQWKRHGQVVARELLRQAAQNPGDYLALTVMLRPMAFELVQPLTSLFADPLLSATERNLAADVLAEYAKEDLSQLLKLLGLANTDQFEKILASVETEHSETAIAQIIAILNAAGPTDKEQANLSIALLRLGEHAGFWTRLIPQDDNTTRSFILERLEPFGADYRVILDQLKQETDVAIRRALYLALGSFPSSHFSTQDIAGAIHDLQLEDAFENRADSGEHAAIAWLLRQWGQDLAQVENTIRRADPIEGKGWYINGQRQTMCVLGPAEFVMGAPADEGPKADGAESLHRRLINRRFAISMYEVTTEQYARYLGRNPFRWLDPDHPECPLSWVTWFQAAAYCNWLSEKEGIAPEEWCYERVRANPRQLPEKLVNQPSGVPPWFFAPARDFLTRSGYRLPTEAEWEYACRGGTTTAYCFGTAPELLPSYAWCPQNSPMATKYRVGWLKPNDFGLFDVHGNAQEWCHDILADYPVEASERIHIDVGGARQGDKHVLRGAAAGDWLAARHRCANREFGFVPNQGAAVGFRIARTIEAFAE